MSSYARDNRQMEAQPVTIAIQDESQGYAISPDRVPLSLLREFTVDVEAFLKGSDKEIDPKALSVAVVNGSFGLSLEPVIAPSLFTDVNLMRRSSDLSLIDAKRRTIVLKWQSAAKAIASRAVKIACGALGNITIDSTTDFRQIDPEPWVDVERYIQGELMDLGGVSSSNAHIRLPDGKNLTVKTDRGLIRAEKENLVYRNVHVRIRAKYNIVTGELRDASLIEFVEYAPGFDEAAFERLTTNGREAWRDVDDPAAWVRQMRGGE